MAFKAIVTRLDGKKAVLTQQQLNLLPNLLKFTKRNKLDSALIVACHNAGCPIDFEKQKETD